MTGIVYHRETYESADAWYAHCEPLFRQQDFPGVDSDHTVGNSGGERFSGVAKWEDAFVLARTGWPEGRSFMADTVGQSAAVLASVNVPCRVHDVGGMFPDVPRYIGGDPLCMVSVGEEERTTRPVIKLVCEQWGSCGVDRKQLIHRGAAICAVVDRFEAMGARVEVTARFSCSASQYTRHQATKKNCIIDVTGKLAGEPLEVDRLAFLLAHPATLRRMFFRQLETFPGGKHEPFHKYCGMPPLSCTRGVERNEIFIPSANENTYKYSTVKDATEEVLRLVREGIESNCDCRCDFFFGEAA